jgi:hypothetical protein
MVKILTNERAAPGTAMPQLVVIRVDVGAKILHISLHTLESSKYPTPYVHNPRRVAGAQRRWRARA